MVTFSYGDSDFGPRAPRFHGAEQEAEADGMAGGVGRGRRRGGRRRGTGAGDFRGAGGPGGAWQPPAVGRQARAAPG
ncbi:MAG: hypothetical protein HY719_04720, partial [Planctomycetes bacterium]|nr:hypothetical protein [Planctomycetota bacterium]